jgi:hypothetical protein
VGCEARKTPAEGEVFFFDSSLAAYRRARSAISHIGRGLPNRIPGSHWQRGKL